MRVLVAEDGPVNRELIQEMLEILGCDITMVEDGPTALAAVKDSDPFDLILLDNNMPGLAGIEVAEAIRVFEAEASITPTKIAVVTGDVLERDLPDLQSHGIDDYLCKPFDLDSLEDLIDRQVHGVDPVSAPSPTASAPSAVPELDTTAIERLRRLQRPDSPSIVGKIAGMFLDSAPGQVETLRAALADRDGTQLQLTAHTLKTSAANVGVMKVSELADEIEHKARAGELDACQEPVDRIETELQRMIPVIEELIDQETVTG